MWFPNRSDTNRAIPAQKMARGWKFDIESRNVPSSENKGLICAFVFPHAKYWFSHDGALMCCQENNDRQFRIHIMTSHNNKLKTNLLVMSFVPCHTSSPDLHLKSCTNDWRRYNPWFTRQIVQPIHNRGYCKAIVPPFKNPYAHVIEYLLLQFIHVGGKCKFTDPGFWYQA